MSRIRAIARRAWRMLGSRRLSFWVIGAWAALLAVWVLPFQLTGQPDATLEAIGSGWWPLRAVYAALLAVTLACTFSRASRELRRARGWASRLGSPPADAPVAALHIADAAESLERAGFSTALTAEGLVAVQHPYAPLGGSLAHLALALLAAGLVVNALTTRSVSLRVTEGQTMSQGSGSAEGVAPLPPALRERLAGMELDSVTPAYFRDVLLFERLDATVDDGGRRRSFALATPLWLDPITHLSIEDFGLAPRFAVARGGRVVQDSTIAMTIFPGGNEDSAVLEGVGWTVSVIAYPDHATVDGRDVSRSYNLRNPKLLVSVADQSGALLGRELLAPGEGLAARDATLTFEGLARYGTFRVTRAWGLPVLVLGGALLVGGLAWRLLRRRLDVRAWAQSDGTIVYDAWLDAEGRAAGRRRVERMLRGDT